MPDATWQEAIETGRRWLLLAHGGEDLAAWPARPLDWVDAEAILGALGEQGFHDEVAQVLATLPERQALDGSLMGPGGSAAANGAALVALARHVELAGDGELAERLVGPVAKSVHWIDKRGRRTRRSGPGLTGDDRAWSIRGLEAAASLLDGIDQPEVAADARAFMAALEAGLDEPPSPSGPGSPPPELCGAAVVDPVGRAGLSPRRTLPAGHAPSWPPVTPSPSTDWRGSCRWPRPPGPGPKSCIPGPVAVPPVTAMTWPRGPTCCASSATSSSARPRPGWRCAACTRGRGWVRGSRCTTPRPGFGRLSFAVRWHGARPALLWDLAAPEGAGPVLLTCPGLDPTWRSTDPRGEALLAPPDHLTAVDEEAPVVDAAVEADPIGGPPSEPPPSFT